MKLFIILGLLATLLSLVAGADYDKAVSEMNEAFPGLNAVSPEIIKVVFDNGAFLDLGKNITPTESKNQPVVVDWNADKDAYYTIMIVDPDAPTLSDPYMRDGIPWLVGNIPGKDIKAGDVIIEYIGVAPPRNYGPNRYVYLLYLQPKKLEFDEKRVDKYTIDGRMKFSAVDFSKKYNLGSPVGLNFLTAYWDPEADAIFRQMNCCEDLIIKDD